MSIKEIDDSYQQTSLFDISDFKAEEAKTAIKQPKKAMNDVPQSSLFSFAYPSFKFAKPVRLIELFAGYGSQMMAMDRLREEGFFPLGFETWRICEWAIPSFIAWAKIHAKDDRNDYSASFDKDALVKILSDRGSSLDWKAPAGTEKLKRKPEEYLRMAYNAMIASRNVVDITRAKASDFAMENRDKYDVVLTWSFPCQSLSLAGKRAGMDEGSGSESSLGYEVLRLLDEMKEIGQLPTVLVMENVPQFASSSNHENIMKIQDRLGKLGYKSYVQIQSATDFGVPQTRKRCFMISVLGDYSYTFPCGFPLTLKLKDKLEDNVDRKYYLSRKMMNYVLAQPTKGYGLREVVNPSIARTVNTNYGRYRAGIDTYVSPDCEEDADLTCTIGGLPIKDATKKGFDLANEGDGVYINHLEGKRGTVQKGLIQTLKTTPDVGVVVSKPICINPKVNGRQPKIIMDEPVAFGLHLVTNGHGKIKKGEDGRNIVAETNGLEASYSLTTMDKMTGPALLVGKDSGEGPKPKDGQPEYGIESDGRIDLSAVYVTDEADPRFLIWDGKEWRELKIRRLTPRECFRLQNVSDADFDLIKDSFAESTLYHLAGDSICVANIYFDFKEMCVRQEKLALEIPKGAGIVWER